jgi:hypothetical protein
MKQVFWNDPENRNSGVYTVISFDDTSLELRNANGRWEMALHHEVTPVQQ